MSMIKIENLTFSYPTSYDNVFENVSFQVDTDWKLGFVGRNALVWQKVIKPIIC